MYNPEGLCYLILLVLRITVAGKLIKHEGKHRQEIENKWDLRDIVTFDLLTHDDICEDDDGGE